LIVARYRYLFIVA